MSFISDQYTRVLGTTNNNQSIPVPMGIQQIAALTKSPQTTRPSFPDNPALLVHLGLDPVAALMAATQLSSRPSLSDASQGGVISLVKACQMYLSKMGYPVKVTGKIDDATAAAMYITAGTTWQNQIWQNIAQAVAGALPYTTVQALADDHKPQKSPLGVLAMAAVGIGAFFYFNKKGR